MSGVKWSDDTAFPDGDNCEIGDIVVGLRGGANYKFDFPSDGIKDGNSNYLVGWATTGAAATDYMQFTSGEAGTPSTITMTSSNADASLDIILKGTGVLDVIGLFTVNGSTSINAIINDDSQATAAATNVSTALAMKTYVDNQISGTPTSIVGTQYQVLANGNFGTNETGTVTLTTPQDIATTSSPTFDALTLTGDVTIADTKGIIDENGNDQLLFSTTSSAVNYLQIANASTGNAPSLTVQGETNVDLNINAAGNGDVLFNGSDVICGDPGSEASGININGTTYNAVLKASDIGGSNVAQFIMHRHSTTLQSLIVGARSNSNTSSHAAVTNSQSLFTLYGAGWTASHYDLFGAIDISVDASGTISGTSSPGRIRFQVTPDGSNTPATALTISNDKTATFAGDIDAGLTNGQLLIGDTGNPATAATLTAGTGITITNAAGSITISGGGGGYSWTEVTGTSQAMAVNNGYITNNAGLVTCTLPASAAIGDTVIVQGKGAGGWRIAQNAGQTINFGSSPTTTGVGGYLESTNDFDSIELICITATTDWAVLTAPQGTLTVA